MRSLKNLTVAVDLTRITEHGSTAPPAFELALKLAQNSGAKLHLVHVFEATDGVRRKMEDDADRPERATFLRVNRAMVTLEKLCQEAGVEVGSELLFGRPWLRLIEEVLRTDSDLLLAGPARCGPVMESLLGSTTLKLLRKCPCPVWVTRGDVPEGPILVAHDLTEVGSEALKWGAALAVQQDRPMRVQHVLDTSRHYRFLQSRMGTEMKQQRAQIAERIADEIATLPYRPEYEIVTSVGSPQAEIFNALKSCSAGLLVMGTLARTGVSGMLIGNTAETLLPWVRCSVLALKPADFVSPVELH